MTRKAMKNSRRKIPAIIAVVSLCAAVPPILTEPETSRPASAARGTTAKTLPANGEATVTTKTDVWRLTNPYSGAHTYTSDTRELGALIMSGWECEGHGQLNTSTGWVEDTSSPTSTADTLTRLRDAATAGQLAYDRSLDRAQDEQARTTLAHAVQDARTLKGITTSDDAQAAIETIHTAQNAVEASLDNDPVLTSMIDWAHSIADDDSHGYSQVTRYGNPNYDCSSLVYYAATHAGFTLGDIVTDGFWTGIEGGRLEEAGWVRVGGDELTAGGGLHWGDILVVNNYERQHTEFYIGGGLILGARGGDLDEQNGDSSGDEISVTNWHEGVFTDVYRWEGTPEDLQAINTAIAAEKEAAQAANDAETAARNAEADAQTAAQAANDAQTAAAQAAQEAADAATAATAAQTTTDDAQTQAAARAAQATAQAAQEAADTAAAAAQTAADESTAKAQAAATARATATTAAQTLTQAHAAVAAARAAAHR